MSITLDGTSGITTPSVSSSGNVTANSAYLTPYTMKNRIINGNMAIDQRNAGASQTIASSNFAVDRFQYYATQASKFT